jgi:putative flavoprotein involved in K+ transport
MQVSTVVVGAGHAGLAVSHFLSRRSIDHVVIERGEVANTWRTERWDSLRLLTPNWQSRLPGAGYSGDDPDGFMTMAEVVEFIDGYARLIDAPVRTHTTVTSVRPVDERYEVVTDQGTWIAPTVVLASGGFNRARIPEVANGVPDSVEMLDPLRYRSPDQLGDGGVLVVGASATGIQLAEEIHRSGRPVTLAVGEHVRLPRLYRGRDIMWWMDRIGVLDERYDEVDDLVRARNIPSPQLIGSPERRTVDLNALTDIGVRLVGRVAGMVDGKAQLSGSLRNKANLADLKMTRLLDGIDLWATENDVDGDVEAPHRFEPTRIEDSPPLSLDLNSGEITTVLWATGFRPDYSWLHARVLDRKGQIRHDAGVVLGAPGMYRIGLNMLRRRKSSFIHGAEDDALDLTDHLAAYLGAGVRV